MLVMLQTSYFFLASLSLRTTHVLTHTWTSELPEAFTCFIDPPLDYSNNSKADFPSKKINMALDQGSHKMFNKLYINDLLSINYELISTTFLASDLPHCTSVSGLRIWNSSQILPFNGLIEKSFRNILRSLCLV